MLVEGVDAMLSEISMLGVVEDVVERSENWRSPQRLRCNWFRGVEAGIEIDANCSRECTE